MIIFIVFLILYLWLAIIDTRKILLNYLLGTEFDSFADIIFLRVSRLVTFYFGVIK